MPLGYSYPMTMTVDQEQGFEFDPAQCANRDLDLIRTAINSPLLPEWLEMRNRQQLAAYDETITLELLPKNQIRIDEQEVRRLKMASNRLLTDLLKLPDGWYYRGDLMKVQQDIESQERNGQTKSTVQQNMYQAVFDLRALQVLPEMYLLDVSGKSPQLLHLMGRLVVHDNSNVEQLWQPAFDPPTLETESAAVPSLPPSYEDNPAEYKKFVHRHNWHVTNQIDQDLLEVIDINQAGEYSFADTDLDLNPNEEMVVSLLLRSQLSLNAQHITLYLNSHGCEVEESEVIQLCEDIRTNAIGQDGQRLVLKVSSPNGPSYRLAPGLVIQDKRLDKPVEDSIDVSRFISSPQEQYVEFSEYRKSDEVLKLMGEIEAFIIHGAIDDSGEPTGFCPPDLSDKRVRVAVMQLFRTLDLPESYVARTLTTKMTEQEIALTNLRNAELKARIKRRDELANDLYAGIGKRYDAAQKFVQAIGVLPRLVGRPECLGLEPEKFHPGKGRTSKEVKKICEGCEVRQACLDYAIVNNEKFGIWGGEGERERRRIKRDRVVAEAANQARLAVEIVL